MWVISHFLSNKVKAIPQFAIDMLQRIMECFDTSSFSSTLTYAELMPAKGAWVVRLLWRRASQMLTVGLARLGGKILHDEVVLVQMYP
jgi:hypothetical protein